MPAYSHEREMEFIARIRVILVQNPRISAAQCCAALLDDPESPLQLTEKYVRKLIKKIHGEQAHRLNLHILSKVLAEYQDEAELAKQQLWNFINDEGIEIGDKIQAIRQLRDISSELLEKMFDAGVFERQLGRVKTGDVPLTPEQQAEIDQALAYVFRDRQNLGDEAAASPNKKASDTAEVVGDHKQGDQ